MGRVDILLPEDLDRRFRQEVGKRLGYKKGNLQTTADTLAEHRLTKPTRIKGTIRNLVATTILHKPPNLEELSKMRNTTYEPEQFAAMIVRLTSPRVSMLVFASGKVIIAGARNTNEIVQATRKLNEMVCQ